MDKSGQLWQLILYRILRYVCAAGKQNLNVDRRRPCVCVYGGWVETPVCSTCMPSILKCCTSLLDPIKAEREIEHGPTRLQEHPIHPTTYMRSPGGRMCVHCTLALGCSRDVRSPEDVWRTLARILKKLAVIIKKELYCATEGRCQIFTLQYTSCLVLKYTSLNHWFF